MRCDQLKRLIGAALISLLLSAISFGQSAPKTSRKPFRSPVRYVVYYDAVDPALHAQDESRRFLDILLDKKAFSKRNLSRLFRYLANRYPTPTILTVQLFTDLEDVETPEEAERGRFSDEDGLPPKYDHAVFIRNGEEMFYYIYYANGHFGEVKLK